jgi:hypothetical protein
MAVAEKRPSVAPAPAEAAVLKKLSTLDRFLPPPSGHGRGFT